MYWCVYVQYRYEHDVLVQQKTMYSQRLLELNNEMTDLTRTYNGSVRPFNIPKTKTFTVL